MNEVLKGGIFNPRWLMDAAILEALQQNRELTMLDTTQTEFTKLAWKVKQLGWLILKELGLK